MRARALFAVLASLSFACGSSDSDGGERKAAVGDSVAIEASEETRAAIGVEQWGASGEGDRTVVHGYDARGKKVVTFQHDIAFGEGTYHIRSALSGADADGDVMMTTEVEDTGSSEPSQQRNDFAKDPAARRVLERMQADIEAKTKAAPQAGTSLVKSLSSGAGGLIECVQSLIEGVGVVISSASQCVLVKPGESSDSCTSAVSGIVDQVKKTAEACIGGGGGGSKGGSQGGSQGGSPSGSPDGSKSGSPSSDERGSDEGKPTSASKNGCESTSSPYALPLPSGTKASVSQGNGGQYSHNNDYSRYAFDFDLDRGDPLTAIADGEVVGASGAVKKGMPCYDGGGIECIDKSNYVLIHHASGNDSLYMHLDTVIVKRGDKVKRGAVIGTVGSTGHSTGPHAHVQLQVPCEETVCKTVPLAFADAASPGVPKSGDEVAACAR
jgi:hypothetical protein